MKKTKTTIDQWLSIHLLRLSEEDLAEPWPTRTLIPSLKDDQGHLTDPCDFLSKRADSLLENHVGISSNALRRFMRTFFWLTCLFSLFFGATLFPLTQANSILESRSVNLAGAFTLFVAGQLLFLGGSLVLVFLSCGVMFLQWLTGNQKRNPGAFTKFFVRLSGLSGSLVLGGVRKISLYYAGYLDRSNYAQTILRKEKLIGRFTEFLFQHNRSFLFYGSMLTHLFWLAMSLSVLAILIVKMQGNLYDYCWNSSLGNERQLQSLIDAFARPIAWTSVARVPSEQDLRWVMENSDPLQDVPSQLQKNRQNVLNSTEDFAVSKSDALGTADGFVQQTRSLWSWFLLWMVIFWCVLPRLFLVLFYFWLFKFSLRSFCPDLTNRYFSFLIFKAETCPTYVTTEIFPGDFEETPIFSDSPALPHLQKSAAPTSAAQSNLVGGKPATSSDVSDSGPAGTVLTDLATPVSTTAATTDFAASDSVTSDSSASDSSAADSSVEDSSATGSSATGSSATDSSAADSSAADSSAADSSAADSSVADSSAGESSVADSSVADSSASDSSAAESSAGESAATGSLGINVADATGEGDTLNAALKQVSFSNNDVSMTSAATMMVLGYDAELTSEQVNLLFDPAQSVAVWKNVVQSREYYKRFQQWLETHGASILQCVLVTDSSLAPVKQWERFFQNELIAKLKNAEFYVVLSCGELLRRKFQKNLQAISQRLSDWNNVLKRLQTQSNRVVVVVDFYDHLLDLPAQRQRLKSLLNSRHASAREIDVTRKICSESDVAARARKERLASALNVILQEKQRLDQTKEILDSEGELRRFERLFKSIQEIYCRENKSFWNRTRTFFSAQEKSDVSETESSSAQNGLFTSMETLIQRTTGQVLPADHLRKGAAAFQKIQGFCSQLSPKCALTMATIGAALPVTLTLVPVISGSVSLTMLVGSLGTLLPSVMTGGISGAALGAAMPQTLNVLSQKMKDRLANTLGFSRKSSDVSPKDDQGNASNTGKNIELFSQEQAEFGNVFPRDSGLSGGDCVSIRQNSDPAWQEFLVQTNTLICGLATWIALYEFQGGPEDQIAKNLAWCLEPLEVSNLEDFLTVQTVLTEFQRRIIALKAPQ